MLKIGITGGIGSGKTTVCKIFELLNIPVYYADSRAKLLMVTNNQLITNIKELLGKNSYNTDLSLNREYIAKIIFNDKTKLQGINDLVHPAVKNDFEEWANKQNSPYVIKEAALLFETGSYQDFDYNVLVSAPLELRILRVMKRDNSDKERVLSRVKNQMDDKEKIKLADYIINNDGEHSLIDQIIELHKIFTKS